MALLENVDVAHQLLSDFCDSLDLEQLCAVANKCRYLKSIAQASFVRREITSIQKNMDEASINQLLSTFGDLFEIFRLDFDLLEAECGEW